MVGLAEKKEQEDRASAVAARGINSEQQILFGPVDKSEWYDDDDDDDWDGDDDFDLRLRIAYGMPRRAVARFVNRAYLGPLKCCVP